MSHSVRAAVLARQGQKMYVDEIRLPPVTPGRVRVRMHAVGVCHSDMSLANGTLTQPTPAVLGHEGSGIVIETGAGVDSLVVGDPVVLNWAPACGNCRHCLIDEPYLCVHSLDAGGQPFAELQDGTPIFAGLGTAAFASEVILPEGSLVKLPDDVPLDIAGIVGCAAFTGIGATLNSAKVKPGESVVVVGLGGVGLCAVQGARIAGAHPIIGIDKNPGKLDLAKQLGADHFLVADGNSVQQVRELTGGFGSDHVVECVGQASTIRQSWSMSRRGGRVTVVGVGRQDERVEFSPLELFHFARTLVGCVFGDSHPSHDLPRIVSFLRSGALSLDALISQRITLEDIDQAFARMARGDGARSLIVFETDT